LSAVSLAAFSCSAAHAPPDSYAGSPDGASGWLNDQPPHRAAALAAANGTARHNVTAFFDHPPGCVRRSATWFMR
jgi:hypothetical protein